MGGRGWGPAENTVDRGSQLSKDDEDDEDDEEDEEEEERRTRQEEAEEEEEKEEKEEEEATDIKSNNPHLAGGEKHRKHTFDPYQNHIKIKTAEPGRKQIRTTNHIWIISKHEFNESYYFGHPPS